MMKENEDEREYEKLEREKKEDEESLKNKAAAEEKANGGEAPKEPENPDDK